MCCKFLRAPVNNNNDADNDAGAIFADFHLHPSPRRDSPAHRGDAGALLAAAAPPGRGGAPVPVSPCSWSFQCQMLRSFTTLCRPSPFSGRMVPREEDDKRLCLLLLTDLDDPTPAPHCSNRQRKMLT